MGEVDPVTDCIQALTTWNQQNQTALRHLREELATANNNAERTSASLASLPTLSARIHALEEEIEKYKADLQSKDKQLLDAQRITRAQSEQHDEEMKIAQGSYRSNLEKYNEIVSAYSKIKESLEQEKTAHKALQLELEDLKRKSTSDHNQAERSIHQLHA